MRPELTSRSAALPGMLRLAIRALAFALAVSSPVLVLIAVSLMLEANIVIPKLEQFR